MGRKRTFCSIVSTIGVIIGVMMVIMTGIIMGMMNFLLCTTKVKAVLMPMLTINTQMASANLLATVGILSYLRPMVR